MCYTSMATVSVVQVTLLERREQAGSKILISGGTRWWVKLLRLFSDGRAGRQVDLLPLTSWNKVNCNCPAAMSCQ